MTAREREQSYVWNVQKYVFVLERVTDVMLGGISIQSYSTGWAAETYS